MEKRGLLELILGHYILQVVYGFYTANLFDELVQGCDASRLANVHGYDEEALTGLLALLADRLTCCYPRDRATIN